METELLIIKINEDYIRFKNSEYFRCTLDKASVFPMDKLDTVKEHVNELGIKGFSPVSVLKLILTEKPYNLDV